MRRLIQVSKGATASGEVYAAVFDCCAPVYLFPGGHTTPEIEFVGNYTVDATYSLWLTLRGKMREWRQIT